jgi:hypothetical protein
MPIGPSHGGRGGGGGFSSSRGGGSRGSSGGGNLLGALIGGMIGGAISSRRRERYSGGGYNGNDNYPVEPATPSRGRPTAFLILAIVMACFTFFTFMIRNGFINTADKYNNTIEIMKADYEEYKDLFSKAADQKDIPNSNPDKTHFITTAKFNGIKYSSYGANPSMSAAYQDFTLNGIQYYFIVYEYKDAHNVTHKGTTYSQFSANQVDGMKNGTFGEIEIAYTVINGQYVSMNTNYTLENCAEYKYSLAIAESNKQLASRVIWFIVGEVVLIALFVFIYIKKLRKYHKLVKEDEIAYSQKQQAEVNEAQARAKTAQKEADQKNRVCAFCGSTVPDGEHTCPACGSRTFE